MVAENAIAQYEGTPLAADPRAAFDKVRTLLPGEVRGRHVLAARAIHLGRMPPPNRRPQFWSALAGAIDGGQQIEIDYDRVGVRQATARRLHPYQLLVRDRDWFLVAHNLEVGSEALYNLLQIVGLRRSGEGFERRARFDSDS